MTVDLTGNYRRTIYAAARRLLADGVESIDMIEIWRNGKLSMSGAIGACAKFTVRENDHGNPSLQLAKWKAFPATPSADQGAKTDFRHKI